MKTYTITCTPYTAHTALYVQQQHRTDLQVVESVELHQVMKLGEGFIGVLKIKGGVRCLRVIEDVKVCQILLLLSLPGNT